MSNATPPIPLPENIEDHVADDMVRAGRLYLAGCSTKEDDPEEIVTGIFGAMVRAYLATADNSH